MTGVQTCALPICPDAQTRFLGISAVRQSWPVGTPVRTTLLITVGDVPGALLNALNPLSRHGVNVRRLEARPTGEPWSYRFFVEFDHASGEADIDAAGRLAGDPTRFASCRRRPSRGATTGAYRPAP